MMTTLRSRGLRKHTGFTIGFLGSLLLTSCAAAPFLVPIAFEFAKNLLQTGLSNYGSKHKDNLSNLVNRLSSPYMQGLPPMAMGGPGMPGQPGFPSQPGMQPQAYPGQQSYSGQQTYSGQAGAYDPNNPYSSTGTAYPGANSYPGTTPNPYGTAQGYPSQPGYDPHNPYGTVTPNPYGQQANPYGTPSPYGQQTNPYGTPSPYGQQTNPYGTSQYGMQNQPGVNPYGTPNPYGTQNPYGGTATYPTQQGYDPNNPYGSGAAQQGYGQTQQGYGQPAQPGYGSPSPYGQPQQQQAYGGYGTANQQYGGQPYGGAGIYPRSVSPEPVAVDVALVRQKITAKGKEVVLMNDGDVLKDGGVNKETGDRFKIVVRTNCDCYLYIISIDGSSWAEAVFPSKGNKTPNPVKKDQEYAFPEGPHWFSLDQVKGIESFFVVASPNRRADLEDSIAQMAAETRPATTIVAKVEEPPVIPRGVGSVKTRGIVTVKDETGTAVQVTSLSYAAGQSGQDVTVTRWFKHE